MTTLLHPGTTTTTFALPTGTGTALIGPDRSYSFDEVAALKRDLQARLVAQCDVLPRRILGCLEDSIGSLMALLACPELTDYMPVNPRLREAEILVLARSGGVDAALLPAAACATLGPKLRDMGLRVIDWDALQATATSGPPVRPGGGRLILHTSGTTGTPKRVPITIDAMMESARNIAIQHELRDDDLALNTLPTFHIGAVVDVLMAPFLAGGSVALTADRSPEGLLAAIRRVRPTWVQLVPTLLTHLVETLPAEDLADLGSSLRFVRNISAPVPARLRDRAEALLGCPIIEMYGMTETAGQISTNGRAAGERRGGTVGRNARVAIKLLDATGNEVPPGRTGEICVSGPTVFAGYEGVPREQTFFADWFRTGDLGQFDADGFLSIRGRLKEMINIGGEKVSPSEIEAVALDHPGVTEAAAYALSHPTLGEVSGLTVAVRAPVDPAELSALLVARLAEFKLPRRIRQVEALPRLPNAKLDRIKIARDAQAAEGSARDTTEAPAHQDPLARKIAALWAEQLKSRPPEGEDDFFDMGGDSLSAVGFLLAASQMLGREIPPNQLFDTPTFDAFVAAVAAPPDAASGPRPRAVRFVAERMAGWPGQVVLPGGLFRGIGTIQNRTPLFWCGQGAGEITQVTETFGARRPLYAVRSLFRMKEIPGARRRKRAEADFEDLARHLADEISTIQPDGPVVLGGFCGGGWVMRHVATELQARGRDLRLFISVDHWPTTPINVPTLHLMTNCLHHSARNNIRDMTPSQDLLHPKGARILAIDTPHAMPTAQSLGHALRDIEDLIDGQVALPSPPADTGWPFAARTGPFRARVGGLALPRSYPPGGTLPFKVRLRNLSDRTWDGFEVSGLGVQIRLINLDGHLRTPHAGFAPLTAPLAPGEVAELRGEIRLPDKRVPMICAAHLQSHGLGLPDLTGQRRAFRLVVPRSARR